MDRDDWMYLGSVTLVALGAGLFHPGAGLICAGLGAAFPFVWAMVAGIRPTKKE